jgi:hypothetical protein
MQHLVGSNTPVLYIGRTVPHTVPLESGTLFKKSFVLGGGGGSHAEIHGHHEPKANPS